MMSDKPALEFVNDWSELEAAVEWLVENHNNPDLPASREDAVQTVAKYVPRLLTQYASLVELSFALTEGWEQYATLQKPTGLYLPDHR
jgi:hypothetical protein